MVLFISEFLHEQPNPSSFHVLDSSVGQIENVEALVGQLRLGSGLSVAVSKPLRNHFLFFQDKGVSPETALKAVAAAIHASVVREGKTIRIVRSPEDLKQLRATRESIRARWIQDKITAVQAYRAKALLGQNLPGQTLSAAFGAALDRSSANLQQFITRKTFQPDPFFPPQMLPPEELLENLVMRIGLDRIAAMPSETSLVFEDDPGLGGEPLPPHDDLLRAYGLNVAKLGTPVIDDSRKRYVDRMQMNPVLVYPDENGISKDKLRLECSCTTAQIVFMLDGYDGSGKRNLHAALDAGPVLGVRDIVAMFKEATNSLTPDYADLSSDSIAQLTPPPSNPDPSKSAQAVLANWVSDPVKNEPLNLWVRDALSGLSTKAGAPCTAIDVPDYLFRVFRQCISTSNQISLRAVKMAMEECCPYEEIHTDQAFVQRQIDPEYLETNQADRKALKDFARRYAPLSDIDARSIAEFMRSACDSWSTFVYDWLHECDPHTNISADLIQLPWSYYNLIGAIGDADWSSLQSGKTLTAGSLGITDPLYALLDDDMVLGYAPIQNAPDIANHPLELYRSAGLGDTPISVQPFTEPMFKPAGANPAQREGWSTLEQFSRRFHFSPSLVRFEGDKPVLSLTREAFEEKLKDLSIQTGANVGFRLVIGLPSNLTLGRDIREHLDMADNPITYADLPAEVKDYIWNTNSYYAISAATRTFQRRNDQLSGD